MRGTAVDVVSRPTMWRIGRHGSAPSAAEPDAAVPGGLTSTAG